MPHLSHPGALRENVPRRITVHAHNAAKRTTAFGHRQPIALRGVFVKVLVVAALPWIADMVVTRLKPKECRKCSGARTLTCPLCKSRGKKREDVRARFRTRAICDAIAGAVSGCVSRFAVGPLDVLKIRFQIQIEPISTQFAERRPKYTGILQAFQTIVREEGITGLWRGTVPGQLLTIPYTAIQFVALNTSRSFLRKYEWAEMHQTAVSFVSGGVAGAAATLGSYPFDLLRTTLAAQGLPKVYDGMFDAAWHIYKAHGIVGLYSGITVTLIEIVPYSALQFASYDFFHQTVDSFKISRGRSIKRTTLENFFCGLAAGIVSKLATHPLDVVKKRYQVAGLQRSLRYGQRIDVRNVQTLARSFRMVIRKEGIKGLWKGSLPNILKAGPAAAVTLVSYEFLIGLLVQTNDVHA